MHGWCGELSGACTCLPGWAGLRCNDSTTTTTTMALFGGAASVSTTSSGRGGEVAARAGFQCASDNDCNLQGLCHNGVCYCRAGFFGVGCEHAYDQRTGVPADAARPAAAMAAVLTLAVVALVWG